MSEGITAPPYRRMSIGDVLSRVFRLVWEARRTFVGIAMVPALTFLLMLGIALGGVMVPFFARMPKEMSAAQNSQMAILFFTSISIMMLMWSAALAPSLGAGCYAAVHADLGRRVTFRESYAFALQRYGRYLALFLALTFIGISPMLIFELAAMVPAMALKHHSERVVPTFVAFVPIGIIGVVGIYVLSIIFMLRLSLAFPASVTESLPVWTALRRSGQLTRGAKGRVFLVLLVVYAACYAVYLAGMLVAVVWFAFLALLSFTVGKHVPNFLTVIAGVITALGAACVMMFSMACGGAGLNAALAVLYNDQRRAIDGSQSDLDAQRAQG